MKLIKALFVLASVISAVKCECYANKDKKEFFLLSSTSRDMAEERCRRYGGKLADINLGNQADAIDTVLACTERDPNIFGNHVVWIKSWDSNDYNGIPLVLNVNAYHGSASVNLAKRDEVIDNDDDGETITNVVTEFETETDTVLYTEIEYYYETSTDVPEEETSTDVPEEETSTNVPEEETSTNVPEEETSTNVPEEVTSTDVPEEETSTSTNVPEEETSTSTNAPEEVTSTDVPEEVTSTNTPEKETSTNAPVETSPVNPDGDETEEEGNNGVKYEILCQN